MDLYATLCVDRFVGREHLKGVSDRHLTPYVEHVAQGNYSAAELGTLARAYAVTKEMSQIGGCANFSRGPALVHEARFQQVQS